VVKGVNTVVSGRRGRRGQARAIAGADLPVIPGLVVVKRGRKEGRRKRGSGELRDGHGGMKRKKPRLVLHHNPCGDFLMGKTEGCQGKKTTGGSRSSNGRWQVKQVPRDWANSASKEEKRGCREVALKRAASGKRVKTFLHAVRTQSKEDSCKSR